MQQALQLCPWGRSPLSPLLTMLVPGCLLTLGPPLAPLPQRTERPAALPLQAPPPASTWLVSQTLVVIFLVCGNEPWQYRAQIVAIATLSVRPCLGLGPQFFSGLGRKRATCTRARSVVGYESAAGHIVCMHCKILGRMQVLLPMSTHARQLFSLPFSASGQQETQLACIDGSTTAPQHAGGSVA